MPSLHNIFSSPAKIKVLRTLFCQMQPLSLRRIAALSCTPVFSVQRAIKQLLSEDWLHQTSFKNSICFTLNTKHASYKLIREIFDLETKSQLRKRAAHYSLSAKSALDFADSSHAFFERMK